ncbi:MAG TPA: helix-turn-helix domain-containing protein [Desulfomonilaceae bacterium]|nr:helix-turn-helix domain-containing protein [Desulfomonilaceae bacterium]
MKSDKTEASPRPRGLKDSPGEGKAGEILKSNIGDSIDVLVEYLVDNNVTGIHPLIMREVEKRLIIKVLQRSRGNKLKAARLLGMGRNTFHRKIQRFFESQNLQDDSTDV